MKHHHLMQAIFNLMALKKHRFFDFQNKWQKGAFFFLSHRQFLGIIVNYCKFLGIIIVNFQTLTIIIVRNITICNGGIL